MKHRLRKYRTCVRELEKHGLTRREISKLIGIDEAVISRRMSGKQRPTQEALIVINILAEVYASEFGLFDGKPNWWAPIIANDAKGWLAEKVNAAEQLNGVGKHAA